MKKLCYCDKNGFTECQSFGDKRVLRSAYLTAKGEVLVVSKSIRDCIKHLTMRSNEGRIPKNGSDKCSY